ncbi:hypothetical protein HUG10_20520 (plasmid) [Halorarum halophilum]|uniref:Uncharacterized protein n=1 Tax=Halorarum halophilum TaxID=2743090 RepID=A0A7D5H3Y4_9EURY|nr:hypothetical protein [Halobaculum halophilum]QLG29993.1 hypothetical protein HUG10_20520 [Halobaculum halophilum]
MTTRYAKAKEIGFEESETNPGLLWWFVPQGGYKIFMDFRTKNDDGEYDGYEPDMPPRTYGADEDDEGNTVWINSSGDTRDRWKEDIEGHWVVKKVERESGLDQDRGQTGLDWFATDGMAEQECRLCGDEYAVSELENGLCFGDDTNGCYFEENPAELFRQARRRKEEIRSERRQEP